MLSQNLCYSHIAPAHLSVLFIETQPTFLYSIEEHTTGTFLLRYQTTVIRSFFYQHLIEEYIYINYIHRILMNNLTRFLLIQEMAINISII